MVGYRSLLLLVVFTAFGYRPASAQCRAPFLCQVIHVLFERQWLSEKPKWISCGNLASCTRSCDDRELDVTYNFGERATHDGYPRMSCLVKFCMLDNTEATDCVRPLFVKNPPQDWLRLLAWREAKVKEVGRGYPIYLPLNVCTREMIATHKCPLKRIAKSNSYNAPTTTDSDHESIRMQFSESERRITDDAQRNRKIKEIVYRFYPICEAGFEMPRLPAPAPDATYCLSSLHILAGHKAIHPSAFDIADPRQVKYCPLGARDTSSCLPRPICRVAGEPEPLVMGWFDEDFTDVPLDKPECEMACSYGGHGDLGRYRNCTPLDVIHSDDFVEKTTLFTAFRAGSGPYAEFMSLEENTDMALLLDASKWEQAPNKTIKYPRCIDTYGLTRHQRMFVERDYFLNCAENPFVQQNPDSDVRLYAQACKDLDPEWYICITDPEWVQSTVSTVHIVLGLFIGAQVAVCLLLLLCPLYRTLGYHRPTATAGLYRPDGLHDADWHLPDPPRRAWVYTDGRMVREKKRE